MRIITICASGVWALVYLLAGIQASTVAAPSVTGTKEIWCSGLLRMILDYDPERGATMTIGEATKEPEVFAHAGSLGTGLNGSVWARQGRDEAEVLLHTTITMDWNTRPADEPMIYIFRDHVFWPCDR